MAKERALITGSNGFIGSRLSEHMSDQFQVKGLKRGWTSHERSQVANYSPDVIVHLAAYGNHHTQTDVEEIYRSNMLRLYHLLDSAEDYRAFIVVGSSSEYGTQVDPMVETMLPEPTTHYAASKVAATMMAKAWAHVEDMPVVTVRPFSVYGPGEASNRFIPTVVNASVTGEEMTLAPGVHDWIYIDDFVAGLMAVVNKADELKGQVVNIGTGKQTTNAEVVQEVIALTGKQVNIKPVDRLREYDTTGAWVADNTLMRSLGWEPQVTLQEGIRRTYDRITQENTRS